MAGGHAGDLASTLLLATDKPVLAVPAMNVRMWQHAATRRNVAQLRADGVTVIEPGEGPMACGEFGPGRLPAPAAVLEELRAQLVGGGRLRGKRIVVPAGSTPEQLDPCRNLAHRSSGNTGSPTAHIGTNAEGVTE